jgi:hypothetical protein
LRWGIDSDRQPAIHVKRITAALVSPQDLLAVFDPQHLSALAGAAQIFDRFVALCVDLRRDMVGASVYGMAEAHSLIVGCGADPP